LHAKFRAISLDLLVHRIPKDEPAIHGTRRLLDGSSRCVWLSFIALERARRRDRGELHSLEGLLHVVLRHLDESLQTTTDIDHRKRDRASDISSQDIAKAVSGQLAITFFDIEVKHYAGSVVKPLSEAEFQGFVEYDLDHGLDRGDFSTAKWR
jgi:hypothetical protein